MDFLEVKIPSDKAYILPIGDIHWGDKAFKTTGRAKLKGNLDWLRENHKVARAVLMGDIYNVAGRDTKTSPWESDPKEYDEASEFFKPYADLILGAITGNHELRMRNQYGVDPLTFFCKHLGIPYLGTSALMRVQVGKREDSNSYWQNYFMAIHHTTGGGGTLGNALNSVQKLEKVISGCDVYAGGHNHQLVTGVRQSYVPTMSGPQMRKIHYVACGSYLDYPNSYAEDAMMAPGKLGSPRIRFNGLRDRHDIHISI